MNRIYRIIIMGTLLAHLVAAHTLATSIAPPEVQYDPHEIIWFDTTGDLLVTYYGDSTVGVWELRTGKLRNHFPIAEAPYRRVGSQPLTLSRGENPMLAVVNEPESLDVETYQLKIDLYDLLQGQKTKTVTLKDALYMRLPKGFISDTRILVLATGPPTNSAVMAVDCDTGKTLWRSENEDFVQTGTVVMSKGIHYVNFCHGNRVVARDRDGRKLWLTESPRKWFVSVGYFPRQPNLPYVVVSRFSMRDEERKDYLALSGERGETMWQKINTPVSSLKAISNDGAKQVFLSDGGLEITCLPKQEVIPVTEVTAEFDILFNDDGTLLLCLPITEVIESDDQNNTETIARKSSVLIVVNANDGTIVGRFDLGRFEVE